MAKGLKYDTETSFVTGGQGNTFAKSVSYTCPTVIGLVFFMNYKDYLQSEHWQNKRKEVISKQGNRCRICNSNKNLNIHHRTYRQYGKSILGHELNLFLLPLCRDCHVLWHKYHGYKRIPFPSIRWKLQAGISKELAFQKPSTSIKTLLRSQSLLQREHVKASQTTA